jgi:hypothetical protein
LTDGPTDLGFVSSGEHAMTENRQPIKITGKRDGERLPSRILEEEIQKAVEAGHRQLTIHAFGQHGIGGRLWKTNGEPVTITVEGPTAWPRARSTLPEISVPVA